MVEERFQVPVIGYLPELNFLQVGSRHLGLVLPDEIDGIRQQLEQLADRMDDTLEWEPLLKIAADAGGRDRSGKKQEPGRRRGMQRELSRETSWETSRETSRKTYRIFVWGLPGMRHSVFIMRTT